MTGAQGGTAMNKRTRWNQRLRRTFARARRVGQMCRLRFGSYERRGASSPHRIPLNTLPYLTATGHFHGSIQPATALS
jgi:hypothetical protein